MAVLALIVACAALGLALEHRIRALVNRRRAVKALGEAMATLHEVEKVQRQLLSSPLRSTEWRTFPKGQN